MPSFAQLKEASQENKPEVKLAKAIATLEQAKEDTQPSNAQNGVKQALESVKEYSMSKTMSRAEKVSKRIKRADDNDYQELVGVVDVSNILKRNMVIPIFAIIAMSIPTLFYGGVSEEALNRLLIELASNAVLMFIVALLYTWNFKEELQIRLDSLYDKLKSMFSKQERDYTDIIKERDMYKDKYIQYEAKVKSDLAELEGIRLQRKVEAEIKRKEDADRIERERIEAIAEQERQRRLAEKKAEREAKKIKK